MMSTPLPGQLICRKIEAKETYPIRRTALWPSVPLDKQSQPYDNLATTSHFGAFLPHHTHYSDAGLSEWLSTGPMEDEPSPRYIAVLSITTEPYPDPAGLPPDMRLPPAQHRQLHKFGVAQDLQGQHIGSALLRYAMEQTRRESDEPILLHLDARAKQEGWYARFGIKRLREGTFLKYGPTGNGPGVEYVRMGILLK